MNPWPFRRPEHLRLGAKGEKLAARYLRRNGMKILARNWTAGKDELDLVAREGDVLVVIEVKTRRNEDWGRPSAAVDRDKRRNLSRAARNYVGKMRHKPRALRFDIVEVICPENDAPEIRHLENVFSVEGRDGLRW